MDIAALLRRARLVPVVTIDKVEDGPPLARALLAGGLPAIEVTLRTPASLGAMAAIAREVPESMAGVGTVLEPVDLARAHAAGARFAFSPGFTTPLVEAARAAPIAYIPGVATAAEAMQMRAAGFRLLKFFPAEQSGGIPALKMLHAPLADLLFCPTGGIGDANSRDYLAQPNVVAVGGSWITPAAEIAAGNWAAITERARKALAALATN